MKPFSKSALIIGAGPAGLTAAYELLRTTDIKPVIVDSLDVIGGLSATHRYKGNYIDVGGHRFFSKEESILSWWKKVLPVQSSPSIDDSVNSRDRSYFYEPGDHDPERADEVLLVRDRLSRIYFNRHFFPYPLTPSFDTLHKLGLGLSTHIGIDYFLNRLHPRHPEKNLEDFFINRFGKKLYEIFFKNYTEKVWGVSCRDIDSEWGRQRVKGVSIAELIRQVLFRRRKTAVETSLISQFYYPKRGVGQMWEEVARQIVAAGGELHSNTTVRALHADNLTIKKAVAESCGVPITFSPDYVFSSAPLKELIAMLSPAAPGEIRAVSDHLMYRDFIMTGILAKTMRQGVISPVFPGVRLLPDTWMYIQEPHITAGRLQIYNNWSPYMVASRNTAWIGLEFFCNEGDTLWSKNSAEMIRIASDELDAMDLVAGSDIIDGVCIQSRKAYPAYWGTYLKLGIVKKYLCSFSNLFCIGRNGLHRYNNMDHSMLTAMLSVKALVSSSPPPESIWDIDLENVE
jgi:protoporphyrinogen oxidase